MKIQNPGSAVGLCRTPLKVNIRENMSVATLPAVSASGIAAMIMCANVEVNTRNSITKSNIKALVSLSWFFPKMAKYHKTHMRKASTI